MNLMKWYGMNSIIYYLCLEMEPDEDRLENKRKYFYTNEYLMDKIQYENKYP